MQLRVKGSDKQFYPHRTWVKMINSLSGFKSLNLLGSVNSEGQHNLSIVSSCIHLGASPPLLGLVLRPHSEKSPRHSLMNIISQGEFTLNHVNKEIYKKAHQASARYPQGVSEFEKCGLTPETLNKFSAPFVKEAKIKMALSVVDIITIKANLTHFIVANIDQFYIPKETLQEDGYIDIEKAGSVSGSSLDGYHVTQKLARLSYAKPNQDIQEILFGN